MKPLLSSKFMLIMAGVWLCITGLALVNGKLLSAGIWALFAVSLFLLYLREQRQRQQ